MIQIEYTVPQEQERIFNELKLDKKTSVLMNGEGTIIRVIVEGVVSKYIFLDKFEYQFWREQVIKGIKEGDETYEGRRVVFSGGLKEATLALERVSLGIDDRLLLKSFRNKIVTFGEILLPTERDLEELKSLIKDLTKTIKRMFKDENQDFKMVERFFNPPSVESRIMDVEYWELNYEPKEMSSYIPDNQVTRSSGYEGELEEATKQYIEEQDLRIENQKSILEVLKKTPEFKEEVESLKKYNKSTTPRERIKGIIKQQVSVCQKCHQKTKNNICSNKDCVSVNPKMDVLRPYTIEIEVLRDQPKRVFLRLQSEKKSEHLEASYLGPEQPREQQESYKKQVDGIVKQIKEEVRGSDHTIKLQIKKEENPNLFITLEGKKSLLERVVFWEQYRYKDDVFSVIQELEQIVTPELHDEALNELKRNQIPRSELGERLKTPLDEYKNIVTVIISDKYGEFKSIKRGVLSVKRNGSIGFIKDNEYMALKKLEIENKSIAFFYQKQTQEYINSPKYGEVIRKYNEMAKADGFEGEEGVESQDLINIIHTNEGRLEEFYRVAPEIYNRNKKLKYDIMGGMLMTYRGNSLTSYIVEEPHKEKQGDLGGEQWIELKRRQTTKTKNKFLLSVITEYVKGFLISPGWSSKNFQKKKESLYRESKENLEKKEWLYSFLTDEKGYQFPEEVMNPITKEPVKTVYENISFLDCFKRQTQQAEAEIEEQGQETEYEVISATDISPFLLKYLKKQKYISEVSLEILTSDNIEDNARISVLTEQKRGVLTEDRIGYVPMEYKTDKATEQEQITILNKTTALGVEDIQLAVAMRIKCKFSSKYNEALAIEFLKVQGLKIRRRTEKFLPISIKNVDFVNLIL